MSRWWCDCLVATKNKNRQPRWSEFRGVALVLGLPRCCVQLAPCVDTQEAASDPLGDGFEVCVATHAVAFEVSCVVMAGVQAMWAIFHVRLNSDLFAVCIVQHTNALLSWCNTPVVGDGLAACSAGEDDNSDQGHERIHEFSYLFTTMEEVV